MTNQGVARQRLVFVTGPSGAGRSTAIAALEDLGFETIDNLPLSLLPRLLTGDVPHRPLALGIDVRNRDFTIDGFLALLDKLAARHDLLAEALYLDARADVLSHRYSETRRRHPLAPGETPEDGIAREARILEPLRSRADVLLDTSELTPHDLRAEIERLYGGAQAPGLSVSVQSFSFKRGLPRGLDTVFDVRFLQNPHWQPDLRPLTGLDPAVAQHVAEDARWPEFFDRVRDLMLFLLPAYADEGKTHFAVGIGCTGGKHRSVAMAEALSEALAEAGWAVSTRHRELERRMAGAGTGPS